MAREFFHVSSENPHDKFSIDLVRRLPCSSQYYYYILSLADIYSKLLTLLPLRITSNKEIIIVV